MIKSRKFGAFITLVIILTTFSIGLYAQAEYDEDFQRGYYIEEPRVFYGGLLLGANFCQVDGDNFAGYHKIGANVGGIVYGQFTKHGAVSLEILFSQKGAKSNIVKESGINNLFIQKYNISANYAEVPIMINYFDKRKSHFGIGVSYSRLVSVSETMTTDPAIPFDFDQYPFRKNNLEGIAGAQLHLVKGLFLNVRFQYSLLPIRTNVPPNFSRAQQFSNVWVVRLMYLFI